MSQYTGEDYHRGYTDGFWAGLGFGTVIVGPLLVWFATIIYQATR